MFLEHSFAFAHEAVRAWDVCFAPLMADKLWAERTGQAGSPCLLTKPQPVWRRVQSDPDTTGNSPNTAIQGHSPGLTAPR